MAGSWAHMTTVKGKLLNNERFAEMIENLGDAYEAAEECYGMIWWLASVLAAKEVQSRQTERIDILTVIERACRNYRVGLRLGGVQR